MRILYHRTMYRIIHRLWYWWHVERALCKAYNWRTRVCMYLELHDLGWQAHKIELDYLEGIANESILWASHPKSLSLSRKIRGGSMKTEQIEEE